MNNTVEQLIARIRHLEDEIEASLHDQGDHLRYRLEGRRILFEDNIKARHRAAKIRWRNWFGETELRHLVSAPFIYSMIVPLVLLDLFLFIYQTVCFRLYRISRVPRGDYIVLDRHHLAYLNAFEKLNCIYCSYGNGLLAYAGEIAALTRAPCCSLKSRAIMMCGSTKKRERMSAPGIFNLILTPSI